MMDDPPIDVLQVYVREVVGGPYCGGADEGRRLAEFLLKVWPRYRKIRVSFREIDVVEFPFCWALADALVRGPGLEEVADKLHVTSLSERADYLLNKALAVAAKPPDDVPDAFV